MFARRTKTGIKPMSNTNVGANLMFARRTTIVCVPMSEAIFEHRFDTGFCSAGEHKVRPYIGFGHWLDFDYYDLPENL
jgi:hypothetical protein